MTVERVHNGFYGGADVKFTEVDHHTSELVGGQGGYVFDDTLFFGGAGYWLVNGSHDREMAYGGFVVQWMQRAHARVGFGARGLIGGGTATLDRSVVQVVRTPRGSFSQAYNVRFYEDFFVAEPEANVSLRLTRHFRVTGGVGYRFTAGAHEDDRLHGVTGTVGFQVW
jgi:hypothetical protein